MEKMRQLDLREEELLMARQGAAAASPSPSVATATASAIGSTKGGVSALVAAAAELSQPATSQRNASLLSSATIGVCRTASVLLCFCASAAALLICYVTLTASELS